MTGGYGDGTYGDGTYGGVTVRPEPSWLVQTFGPGGWIDRTCDVRMIDVNAGRSSYVDSFEASALSVVFANFAGVYSTYPPDSIWRQADGYATGVPIRAGSLVAGTVEWRFTGATDAVVDSWPGTTDAVATVTASDALAGFARHNGGPRTAVGAGELTGARVNRLADDCAYAGPRRVDAGTVALVATTLDGTSLDLMRQVGESEWGWLYVAGDGALIFRQRDAYVTDPRMNTAQYVVADTDAIDGACYGEAELASDATTIINTAAVTVQGAVQSYSSSASITHFGPRTWTRTDLPIRDTVDGTNLAQTVVTYYSSDEQRIDAVTIDAANHADNWAPAHGTRITDRLRFIRTFPGGYQLDAELLVQGRTDHVEPVGDGYGLAVWTVRLQTARALAIASLGPWDVAGWNDNQWGV